MQDTPLEKRAQRRQRNQTMVDLNLVSLIDIFTILIFFLLANEVAGLQAGRLQWPDVEDRIRERRIEHIRLCKMGPPKTIGIDNA